MRLLFIHNSYYKESGEERSLYNLTNLISRNGNELKLYKRSTDEIEGIKYGRLKAFSSSLYNRESVNDILENINSFEPDIVQVQNLYPLISPSILPRIKEKDIPVVMRTPNFRLFCPTGLFYTKGAICERCVHSSFKELNCVLYNCTNSLPKSAAYATRNAYARVTEIIKNNVDAFIVQSEFYKQKFIAFGIPENKISIIPGFIGKLPEINYNERGEYISFIGRLSPEKGIYEFIRAARALPDIPFLIAGNHDRLSGILNELPSNVTLTGHLRGKELDDVYRRSKAVVAPSLWYDSFPNTVIEAMSYAKTVIVSNLGPLPNIIEHEKHGLVFDPADREQLTSCIDMIYHNTNKAREMGMSARKKVESEYNSEIVYSKLMDLYGSLISTPQ